MKSFLVMRQLTTACGAVSEPLMAFATREAAEGACQGRSKELQFLQTWRLYQDGRDIGRSGAELLAAFGIDGIGYFVVEVELHDSDLLKPSEQRIILS